MSKPILCKLHYDYREGMDCRELYWFNLKQNENCIYKEGNCLENVNDETLKIWDYGLKRSCDNCVMGIACYKECYPKDNTLAKTCKNYGPPVKPEIAAKNMLMLSRVFGDATPIQ